MNYVNLRRRAHTRAFARPRVIIRAHILSVVAYVRAHTFARAYAFAYAHIISGGTSYRTRTHAYTYEYSYAYAYAYANANEYRYACRPAYARRHTITHARSDTVYSRMRMHDNPSRAHYEIQMHTSACEDTLHATLHNHTYLRERTRNGT